MIWSILHSKYVTIISGILLIGYAIYDIYEELFQPAHEHILIAVGVLLIISSFGHLNEGIYQVVHTVSPNKELNFLEKVGRFFRLPVVRIILGITVLIAAIFGFYEDYEKLHSKSVSMGVGLLTFLLPISKAYFGGENLLSGLKSNHNKKNN